MIFWKLKLVEYNEVTCTSIFLLTNLKMSKQKILLMYVVSSSKQIHIPTAVKLRCTSLYMHAKVCITLYAHSLFWTDRWSETQLPLTTNTVSFNVSSKTRLTFWCCGLPTAFFSEFVLEKEIIVYNWNDKYHSHPLIQKYHWNSNFYFILFLYDGTTRQTSLLIKKKKKRHYRDQGPVSRMVSKHSQVFREGTCQTSDHSDGCTMFLQLLARH